MLLWFIICTINLLHFFGPAKALFENCNNTYAISEPNRLYYLNSPYYPEKYPPGTSCMYILTVPQDYEIVLDCSISLPKSETTCTTDSFFISRNGDTSLIEIQQFCGTGNLTRTSLFNKIVLAYTSTRNSTGGRFTCKITTRPQVCDCGWSSQTRIVGGVPVPQHEYPSIVSLRLRNTKTHFCAGTIINHYYIATAAHCTRFLESPKNMFILAGYNGTDMVTQFTRIYEALEFIEYPAYNWTTLDNDIALIRTKLPMEWSRDVGPICLPLDQLQNNFDYERVDLVGWGTTFFAGPLSNNLLKATVNIVPNSICQTNIPSIQPSQICTYFPGKDACQRDSGGPVVLKGEREYLIGIISKGGACGVGPGINTRTTSYIEWISQTINGNVCYKPFHSQR